MKISICFFLFVCFFNCLMSQTNDMSIDTNLSLLEKKFEDSIKKINKNSLIFTKSELILIRELIFIIWLIIKRQFYVLKTLYQ